MHNLEPIIREHPVFKNLDPRYTSLIVGCAANVVVKPDQFLFHEGDKANRFYILREGTVALEIFAPGRGALVVETLSGGDLLGFAWIVPPYTQHFDAHAIEQVRAIGFDAECLRRKCEEDHELGYELFQRFSGVMTAHMQSLRLQLLDMYGAVPA